MPAADRDAEFTDFVSARWGALYRAAYVMVPDHARAEDLLQAALLATYRNWGRIKDPHAREAYARSTIANTAIGWFRKKSFRERPVDVVPDLGTHDTYADHDLLAAIGRLPVRQRAVVMLRYYADLSVAETARELAISEGTVKSQAHKALESLRSLLGTDAVDAVEGEDR
ncbi:SigE family RNA polymerase sigma factor [Nocardioides panacisoli]|uniref:SigE family RNA polymerase sigma factor n=1 Tax=Nocardioides panacisoli TaxID=627624 RepID=UPI001C6325CB|nr:SigE family RNA polymerase sigma factor [Nocardioides panacisoli]QYJ04955.1 SigE family RNA polymerase sigma factor [Nocardioides panacisoli]